MNTMGKILLALILLFLIPLALVAQGNYVPTRDEIYYAIWTNKEMAPQKTVFYPDGSFEDYSMISDTTAIDGGISKIIRKWTDSEGNTWYNCFDTFTKGNIKGLRTQTLWKISNGGAVGEFVYNEVGDLDPNQFPTKLDPNSHRYFILIPGWNAALRG